MPDMPQKSRGGRPPKAERVRPVAAGAALVSARVSAETRAIVEQAAQDSGRSLSQQVDQWLTEASRGHRDFLERAGGPSTASAFRVLAKIALQISAEVGDPAEDEFARLALLEAWEAALPHALPHTRDAREWSAYLSAEHKVREACGVIVERLLEAGENDPAVQAALQQDEPVGLLAQLSPRRSPAMHILGVRDREDVDPEALERSFAAIEAGGVSLDAALKAARSATATFTAAKFAWRDRCTIAREQGRKIGADFARSIARPKGETDE